MPTGVGERPSGDRDLDPAGREHGIDQRIGTTRRVCLRGQRRSGWNDQAQRHCRGHEPSSSGEASGPESLRPGPGSPPGLCSKVPPCAPVLLGHLACRLAQMAEGDHDLGARVVGDGLDQLLDLGATTCGHRVDETTA